MQRKKLWKNRTWSILLNCDEIGYPMQPRKVKNNGESVYTRKNSENFG